jgi:hypothetical protein
MSADWSINISKSGTGAAFIPDFPNAQQGEPLKAHQDDLVTWYNMTDDDHQPWQTDSNYNPCPNSSLSALIPAGESSDSYDCAPPTDPTDPCSPSIDPTNPPGPAPQTWTIYYYCNRHPDDPNERGSINVAAEPTSGVNIIKSGAGASFAPSSRGASEDDLISWNNTTNSAHQPWPTDANYHPLPVAKGSPQYLSDEIPPGESSLTYRVAAPAGNPPPDSWTVYYYCKKHPNDTGERGTIVVPPPS